MMNSLKVTLLILALCLSSVISYAMFVINNNGGGGVGNGGTSGGTVGFFGPTNGGAFGGSSGGGTSSGVGVPQSSVLSPPSATTWVHCTQVQVYTPSQVLQQTMNYINLGGGVVEEGSQDGGFLAWAVGNGGGTMTMGLGGAGCDNSYPYICGMNELWVMVVANGATTLSYSCCSTPQPPMALVYDNTTWQKGKDCTLNGAPAVPPNNP